MSAEGGRPRCCVEGCERPYQARGWCSTHYTRWRKHGDPLFTLNMYGKPATERFWAKVDKTAGEHECWLWTAGCMASGYGAFGVTHNLVVAAHRFSFEEENGPIPEGLVVDHRCGTRRCVNPTHLRAITQRQNLEHRTRLSSTNTSGYRGVLQDPQSESWFGRVRQLGKQYYTGRYASAEEADAAARELRARIFTHDDHDEFVADQRKRSEVSA